MSMHKAMGTLQEDGDGAAAVQVFLGTPRAVSAGRGRKGSDWRGRERMPCTHHSPGPFKPIVLFFLSSNPESWTPSFLPWALRPVTWPGSDRLGNGASHRCR